MKIEKTVGCEDTISLYEGRESDIVQACWWRDRRERARLRKELGDAIQRHLNDVRFWDEHSEPNERQEYVAKLSEQQSQELYNRILLLTQSLEEAQMGGVMWPDEGGKHGFTLWYARLGRRLGSRTCNYLGMKMCKDMGFTVAKGREICTALKSYCKEIGNEGTDKIPGRE